MSRFTLLDEIGGSLRTPEPRPSLTRPVLKHYPGKHNQKDHGRRGGLSTLERRGIESGDIARAFAGEYETDTGLKFRLVVTTRERQQVGSGPDAVDAEVAGGDIVVDGEVIGEWARAVHGDTMHALFLTVGKTISGRNIEGATAAGVRGKGIALTVQKRTEEVARELGLTSITVSPATDGIAAWAQERFGYRFSQKPSLRAHSTDGRPPKNDEEAAVPIGGVGYPGRRREYRGSDGLLYGFAHPDLGEPGVKEALAGIERRLQSDDPGDWPAPHEIITLGTGRRVYDDIIEGRTLGEYLLSHGWKGVKPSSHVTKALDGMLYLTVLGEQEPVTKHLPGQHDQKTHGRGGNHGLDPKEQVARAKETGESMHLPYPCPPELKGAWDAAEDAKTGLHGAAPSPEGNALKIRAMAYAVNHGMSHEDDEDDEVYTSAAETYANAILRRRMDVTAQQKAWDAQTPEERNKVGMLVQEVRHTGDVCIAVPASVAEQILDDGRFLSQFEAMDSRGNLDSDLRAMAETAVFDHHPHVAPVHRPIYGYIAPPGKVLANGVSQYGSARFVLKPTVHDRSTMTIGDSLNTYSTPIPFTGKVTARDISDATARTIFGDSGQTLVRRGVDRFVDWDYFEAQIHGGVTLDDVMEVHLPSHLQDLVGRKRDPEQRDYIEGRFREYKIPVVWYDDPYDQD